MIMPDDGLDGLHAGSLGIPCHPGLGAAGGELASASVTKPQHPTNVIAWIELMSLERLRFGKP